MISSPSEALSRALDVLEGALDIVRERVADARAPSWADRRDLTNALLAMPDRDLSIAEALGLPRALPLLSSPLPAPLVELCLAVADAAELRSIDRGNLKTPILRGVGARKRHQLAALLEAIAAMASSKRRIVDIGAGKGHFSRAASEAFAKEVLGLDRDPARVHAAAAMGEAGGRALFVELDVFSEAIPLAPDDLAVGLHACGEVGDRAASSAAEAGSDLALVSCCLQKIRGEEREPLSAEAKRRGARFPREILGLSNLTSRPVGVERPLDDMLAAREHRLALRILLASRGYPVEQGEELRGINRRRARAGLAAIAPNALELRGLSPPTDAEMAWAASEAAIRFPRIRRLNLPRAMLARLLEVAISLDRAALFEERGVASMVVTFVNPTVTARNVVVFASSDKARLPDAL